MKKITCLLALFLLCLGGTAVAQVITSVGSPVAPSAIQEGKTYVLYAQEKGYAEYAFTGINSIFIDVEQVK